MQVSNCCNANFLPESDVCSDCKEHASPVIVYDQDEAIDKIIAYECGEFDHIDTIRLFSHLLRTGEAWTLQGHYGRMAEALIANGYLEHSGEILTFSPEFDG